MSYLSQHSSILSRLGSGNWDGFNWYKNPNDVVPSAEYFKKNGYVRIDDSMVRSEWIRFLEHGDRDNGIVVASVDLPRDWPCPRGIRVIQNHSYIFRVLDQCLDKSKDKIVFHRQVSKDQPRFVALGGEFDRVIFMQWLRAVGLDRNNLLYHPGSEQLQFAEDHFDINPDLRACETKLLEPYHRFDPAANFDVLSPVIQSADFELVLTNRCLQEPAHFITEKDIWHIFFGVPGIVLEYSDRRRWFEELGFIRHPYIFHGTGQVLYHSVIQWLCYYQQFTLSQRQRWQDQQGERVYRNFLNIDRAVSILLERLDQQVSAAR